jgi:hypothetical protein
MGTQEGEGDQAMTRDEIIALANKLEVLDTQHYGTLWVDKLVQFAAEIDRSVRADEREACEKACAAIAVDRWSLYKGRPPYTGKEDGRADTFVQGESSGASDCVESIRARGDK